MRSFTGEYSNRNFILSDDNNTIKMQLVSILNTPLGSRFYYPSYGSRLNEYRFAILNYYTVNMIGQEIKNAISLLDGVKLTDLSYYIDDTNSVYFTIEVSRLSNIIRTSIKVTDGVAM